MEIRHYFPSFNPRTHEECDLTPFRNFHLQIVSIHALTRSATFLHIRRVTHCLVVSIHALTRSATYLIKINGMIIFLFQSTHSRGVRRHALELLELFVLCFNPRTHEECDCCDSFSFFSQAMFQSTHSRGVRQNSSLSLQLSSSFNPRTHEECD